VARLAISLFQLQIGAAPPRKPHHIGSRPESGDDRSRPVRRPALWCSPRAITHGPGSGLPPVLETLRVLATAHRPREARVCSSVRSSTHRATKHGKSRPGRRRARPIAGVVPRSAFIIARISPILPHHRESVNSGNGPAAGWFRTVQCGRDDATKKLHPAPYQTRSASASAGQPKNPDRQQNTNPASGIDEPAESATAARHVGRNMDPPGP